MPDNPDRALAVLAADALQDACPAAYSALGKGSKRRAAMTQVVSAVLEEASAQQWIQKQLDETGIRSMDFRNGIDMEMEPAKELLGRWVAAARTMLGDAPNYAETVAMDIKVAESPERYSLVVQRLAPGALTPHRARQLAEDCLAQALGTLAAWLNNDDRDPEDLAQTLQKAGTPIPGYVCGEARA